VNGPQWPPGPLERGPPEASGPRHSSLTRRAGRLGPARRNCFAETRPVKDGLAALNPAAPGPRTGVGLRRFIPVASDRRRGGGFRAACLPRPWAVGLLRP